MPELFEGASSTKNIGDFRPKPDINPKKRVKGGRKWAKRPRKVRK